MRLLRLSVRNFRGVDECNAVFGRTGVTVVEGANETGKSSLAEALDLLLDFQDSSKALPVRDVKPVHRDEGAEVSAEIEAGPYRFTYEKRFHKRSQTTLTVTAPRPESHTGREAHERALAILTETVDLALWRALRIAQGDGRDAPDLSGRSLVSALERAGGGAAEQTAAESLFAAAAAEAARYVGKSGNPLKAVTDLAAALTAAEARVAELSDTVRATDEAIVDLERLRRERAELVARRPTLQEQVERCAAEKATLDEKRRDRDRLQAAADHARGAAERAVRERDERVAAIEVVADAESALTAFDEERQGSAPELQAVRRRLANADAALVAARAEAETAARLLRRRTDDREFRRHEIEREQFAERVKRLEGARTRRTEAAATLDRGRVDDDSLAAIRDAHMLATQARARAAAEAASVRIEALADVEIDVDGDGSRVPAGSEQQHTVEDATSIRIGELARVTVQSGAGVDARRARDAAEAAFAALLDGAGVTSFEGALESHRARERAVDELRRADEDERGALRDLDETELRHKLAGRTDRVAGYAGERAQDVAAPALAPDFETSKALAEQAESERDRVAAALTRAETEVADSRTLVQSLQDRDLSDLRDRSELVGAHRAEATRLAEQRSHRSDEALRAAAVAARELAAEHALRANTARNALERASPELVDAALAGAHEALHRAESREQEIGRETSGLLARVEILGAQGIGERLAETVATRDRASYAHDAARRRMNAAHLLSETLRGHRDAARRAYRAPLAARIDDLGRYVFGEDFAIDLDEHLALAARTLGGRTVPFRSLSVGAREQLALIARIAAAKLVSESGGVPLILDDALGHSDPDRLARMGAVLSRAGNDVQIVLLTCRPERAAQIAGAHVVRIGASARGAAATTRSSLHPQATPVSAEPRSPTTAG